MGYTIQCFLALFLCTVAAAADKFPFAGTWTGETNDLPAVELVLHGENGRINGSIGFYFQSRKPGGKWELGEKMTVPLLSPKIDGTVLTFETIHHKKHGSAELGPNNKYRVRFVSAHEARLQILKDQPQDDTAGFKLTRR
jgi:hypothetical protein